METEGRRQPDPVGVRVPEHPAEFKAPDGKVKKTVEMARLHPAHVDGEVKTYFMPNAVYEQIEDYQLTPGWEFDEVPMPFDITLKVKNAGKMTAEYQVIGDPRRTQLTQEEIHKMSEAGSIRAYQEAIYESQGVPEQPERTIVRDEVPLPPEPPTSRFNSVSEQSS